MGPVVQRLIIAKPGLHLNLVSLFFFFMSHLLKTFHQIVDKKNGTEFSFKAFRLTQL